LSLPKGWASEAYFEFCETETQTKYLKAVIEHGSNTKAAKELGMGRRAIDQCMARIYSNAVKRGYDPRNGVNATLPRGHTVKGISQLLDAEGNIKQQWVKSDAQKDGSDVLRGIIDALTEEMPRLAPVKYKGVGGFADLLTVYPIGDAHVGMYAWAAEAGEDFDLKIAEQDLCAAFDRLIDSAPCSKEAWLINLGDFYHADDSRNETPGHKNKLDVDGRFDKVMWTGVKILRYGIDKALKKHETVRVRVEKGNHDPHAAVALTMALKALYEKEPRVIIEDTPANMWFRTFGNNLIATTHGDKQKPEKLPSRLAVDAMHEWHREFKYILHGHFHTTKVTEDLGVHVEGFRILAPNDAWHQAAGYRSGKEMQCLVFDKDCGILERHHAGLRLIRKLQKRETKNSR